MTFARTRFAVDGQAQCSQCLRWLSVGFYQKHPGMAIGIGSVCKNCARDVQRRSYVKRIERLNQIKMSRGCYDCGFDEFPEALEFDHQPGAGKLFDIGQGKRRTWALIETEIAKCDVVCANCHR